MQDLRALVDEVSSWLVKSADEVDRTIRDEHRERVLSSIRQLNERAAVDESEAFYCQQLLLARIYDLELQLPRAVTAEGSVVIHQITRELERATASAQDLRIPEGLLADVPSEPAEFVSWLKAIARQHRAFKHPYYTEFIRHDAGRADLRSYMLQESVIDAKFDDLLALIQVGTAAAAKMEIATNFWDEMGNGRPEEVHTYLFNRIFDEFDVSAQELANSLTGPALLCGNLAVMTCRYRHRYAEAVGYLGMIEWLVPDRFVQVVRAWERLGLSAVGITYHKLHITVDSRHAAGWFHNVVEPAAQSPAMRRGIARGAVWRLNSSARYLNERLVEASTHRAAGKGVDQDHVA